MGNASPKHLLRLSVNGKEKLVAVTRDELLIGRDQAADISILHLGVSRRHASLRIEGGKVFVKDLGSTAGTLLNGKQLKAFEELLLPAEGAELRLTHDVVVNVALEPAEGAAGGDESSRMHDGGLGTAAGVSNTTMGDHPAAEEIVSSLVSGVAEPAPAAPAKPSAALARRLAQSQPAPAARNETELLKPQQEDPAARAARRESADREAREIREQAKRDAEQIRNAARAEADTIREGLKGGIAQARTDIERLETERERLQVECRSAAERLASMASELDARVRKQADAEAESQARSNAIAAELARLVEERALVERSIQEARSNLYRIERETHDTEKREQESRKQIQDLEAERQQGEETFEALKARLEGIRSEIEAENGDLEKLREEIASQQELSAQENRKREAAGEALEAEFRVKRLSLEAAIGQVDIRKIEAEQTLQSLLSRQRAAEDAAAAATAGAERRVAELEKRTEKLTEDLHGKETQLASLTQALAEREARAAEAEKRADESEAQAKAAIETARAAAARVEEESRAAIAKAEEAAKAAVAKAQENAKSEIARSEQDAEEAIAKYERSTSEAKQRADAVVRIANSEAEEAIRTAHARSEEAARAALARAEESVREAKQKAEATAREITTRAKEERERLEAQIEQEKLERRKAAESESVASAKKMETDLAEARVRELDKIQRMAEEERKAFKARVVFMGEEIVRKAVDMSKQSSLAHSEEEFRKVVQAILDGKTAATTTAAAEQRSRAFWRKNAIRAAIPVAAGILYAIFPWVPGKIRDSLNRSIASTKDDGGAFLAEIRARSMKYNPEQDRKYRSTYGDNILYLAGYAEMKLDENEQKKWTLLLNDFITGRLGLSDQTVADFVATEAVLVKELIGVREKILPQYKDQGLEKLAETEKQEVKKMLEILQSPENYQKFRNLEREYYEEFMKGRK